MYKIAFLQCFINSYIYIRNIDPGGGGDTQELKVLKAAAKYPHFLTELILEILLVKL